jgi:hypothetical protein
MLLLALLVGLLLLLLNRVPESYPQPANPLPPPKLTDYARFALVGFESPYLGHTGSWNGKGGNMWSGSKVPDLEKEVEMGLRWTFMPVSWSAMENGPWIWNAKFHLRGKPWMHSSSRLRNAN